MKKISYYSGIATLIIALGAIGFYVIASTGANNEVPIRNDVWYQYDGPSSSDPNYENEIMDVSRYTRLGETHNLDCENGTTLCAIKLPDNGPEPDEDELEERKTEILASSPDVNSLIFEAS